MKKGHLAIITFGIALTGFFFTQNAFATQWNYDADYTVVIPQVGQGSGNAWYYKMADPLDRDGIYANMTVLTAGCYSNNPPNPFHYACAGPLDLHPGTFNGGELTPDTVIGFRAPSTDTYHVTGSFADNGDATADGFPNSAGVCTDISTTASPGTPNSDVNVPEYPKKCMDSSNRNEAMRAQLGGVNPLPTSASFDFDVTLQSGQFLYFRVTDLGRNFFDWTAFDVTITDSASTYPPGVYCNGLAISDLVAGGTYNLIDNHAGLLGTRISGTNGNDLILLSNLGNHVQGKGGDDCIIGGAANDVISGGNGDDQVFGGAGNDHMTGRLGLDKMFGGDNNDIMSGNQGNDAIHGDGGDDILLGREDDDSMYGDAGNDGCYGEAGADTADLSCEISVP